MHVRVITPPAEIVTLDEIRRHIVELPVEDHDYVKMLVQAATDWLDGPAGWLGRALGVQTLEAAASGFCDHGWGICLPYPPCIDIVSVVYIGSDGTVHTVADDQYALADGRLGLADGATWPAVRSQFDAVRIRYRAGYGLADAADPPNYANNVPASVKVAICMLVAQWYRTREPVAIGATVETLPFAVDALLSPLQLFS